MELVDFVSHSAPGLPSWSFTDQIRFFAWHLHSHRGQAHFETTHVRRCFEQLHLKQPANLSSLIQTMVGRKPPDLLKNGTGYRLEARVRAQFDSKYGQRLSTVLVDKLLTELPAKVPDLAERKYLDETLRCFRVGAFRATVVMAWNLAYSHLCHHVLTKRLSDFNAAIPRAYPRDKTVITKMDDFAEMKEFVVLQVCRTADITPKNMAQILGEKLAGRNRAAHPTDVEIDQLTAEETVKSLVENVVLKLV